MQARYIASEAFEELVDRLVLAHLNIDPLGEVRFALGELANVWDAALQSDPDAEPGEIV